MKFTKSEKSDAIHNLRRLGIDLDSQLYRWEHDQSVAKTTKQFLTTFTGLSLRGRLAARRVERLCDEILANRHRRQN